MALSNSVLRRYTPPTCTLQIIARSSPLSRWAGRPVLKQLRFELHLDDPQLSEEQKFNIQGDGDQLDTLHAELTNYVQHLLNQSPEHLSNVLSALTPTHPNTVDPSNPQALSAVDASQAPDEASSASDPIHASAPPSLEEVVPRESDSTVNNKQIYLSQGRGLAHNLFLGPLATETTGPVIPLGTLEIFDLVTALDEYAADMVALPAPSRRFSAPPAWVSIAALVLVTAGLSTAVVQFLDRQHSQQQVATNAVPQDSSDSSQIAPQPSLLPGGGPPLPTPETLPSAALPPLGALPPASSRLQPRTLPRANLGFNGTLGTPGGLQVQRTPGFPSIPRPGAGQVFTTTPIRPELPQAPIFVNPKVQQNRSVYNPFKPGVSAPGGARISSLPDEQLPGTARSLPSLSPANPDLAISSSAANGSIAANNASTPLGGGSSTPASPKEPKSTAFDTIPQVAEAREFFEQRWKPPSSLTQTLEYNLILGVDGKIQRIEPLGQAARNYIDRTGIPLIGEPFVSPNKSGQAAIIRVVLSPDGKVQTFAQ